MEVYMKYGQSERSMYFLQKKQDIQCKWLLPQFTWVFELLAALEPEEEGI